MKRLLTHKFLNLKTIPTFAALKSGQGDALTTDDSILYGMADEDPNYELVGGTFTDEPYGIAVKKEMLSLLTN